MSKSTPTEELLRKQIAEQQEILNEFKGEFERISELSLQAHTIIAIDGKRAVLSNGIYIINNEYEVGQLCLIHPQTGQVIEKINHPFIGDLHIIEGVHKDYLTISIRGDRHICYPGKHKDIKVGDIVLLDSSLTVVTFVVEKVKPPKASISKVTWDDIGGHHEAKEHLREAIELPYKHPDLYAKYGKDVTSGILFYGPAGCGKTMLGKATAHAVGSDDGFIVVKGPELLNQYVGETERAIRNLFTKARAHKQKSGKPAVIFIDEAESLLAHRSGRSGSPNYMGQTVVPAFLAEMDGLSDRSAIVILSTNRRDMLDEAIIRDGRIDHKIEIKRPDAEQAKQIFSIHMNHKPVMKGHTKENLIEFATSTLYQHKLPFSGALIAGTVDKAVTHALRRDISKEHVSGLSDVDFKWATEQVIKQETAHAA